MPDDVSGLRAQVVYVWREIQPLVVVSTVVAVVIVEGWTMLAERYLRERYRKGREEGKAEGKAEERRAWQRWNERRAEAEREGRPFDEPPPGQQPKQ